MITAASNEHSKFLNEAHRYEKKGPSQAEIPAEIKHQCEETRFFNW